jgi:hypothetical protein
MPAATDNGRPTELSEKTPIQTNLRAVCLAAAGVAIAVWWGSNWMSGVTNALQNHSAAIQTINAQLAELKTGQDRNFERLLTAIEGRGDRPKAYPASAPAQPRPNER